MKKSCFFHLDSPDSQFIDKISHYYGDIAQRVTTLCGQTDFHTLPDGSVAFAGSLEQPKLNLTLSVMSTGNERFIYADLDDQCSWHECDFDTTEKFLSSVASEIAIYCGQTIRTVTEKKRHRYLKISRYRKQGDRWELIDCDTVSHFLVRLFIMRDSTSQMVESFIFTTN